MGISQMYLLAFISVLSLASAQTTTGVFILPVTPQQTSESVTSTTSTTTPSITHEQTSESVTSTTTSTTPSMPPQQTSESVTSTTTSTTPSSLQWKENFYPFGSAAGDNHSLFADNENFNPVNLSSPFQYFGRQYHLIYVNNNGFLSLSREIPHIDPLLFPYGGEDLIAPFWTQLYSVSAYYQEYTSGHVLTRATQDINRYYPGLSFSATWVFVATWDTLEDNSYSDLSVPLISVQVVLISDGSRSFILMNYGDIENSFQAKAGYGTIDSTHYFVIPGSNDSNLIPNLKYTSNVHVPGRWAFMAYPENVVGLQIKVTSYLDLTDNGNLAVVLEKIKHELVIRGVSSDVQLSARSVKKIL